MGIFALVAFEGEKKFIRMNAEKVGGKWEVGGDNPRALEEVGGKVFIVSKGKVYRLSGNRLIFADMYTEEMEQSK